MDIEVPANTRATVYVPAKSVDGVKEGTALLSAVKDISVKGMEGDYVVMELGSGKYHFTASRYICRLANLQISTLLQYSLLLQRINEIAGIYFARLS